MPQAKTTLSDSEKSDWSEFCHAAGESEAVMLRRMILKVSAGTVPSVTSNREEPKTGKVTVRFTDQEKVALLSKAELEGYGNPTRWATAVLRAALHREPVLTDSEIAALRESNRQLAAIGRNLNQVARALNIEFRESDKLKREAIERLVERIEQHKGLVSGLIDRNLNRWGSDG